MRSNKKFKAVYEKEMKKLLDRVGYTRSKAKYGKSKGPDFPDYSVGDHRLKYKSGNCFAPTTGKKQLPPDAKQFPVGNSHKQGPMLIIGTDDLQYMGGKKT